MRVFVVDDEPMARRVLREELTLQPGTEIVGEADSGVAALKAIAELRPDVVLLDLHMPEMNGFELIENLKSGDYLPVLIVVTAYDQFAIQAFEAGATDYLLKPVCQARLAQSLDRARQALGSRIKTDERSRYAEETAGSKPPMRKIVGRLNGEFFLLDASEVMAFQAEGVAVWIVTAKQRYLATQRLRNLQTRLGGAGFRRIHRNALVNVDHIRKMASLSSNRWLITLNNNQEFVVSKRMAWNIRQILSGHE